MESNRFTLSERAWGRISADELRLAGAADYLKLCELCATILQRAELDATFDWRAATPESQYVEQLASARAGFQHLFAPSNTRFRQRNLATRAGSPREGYTCEQCGSGNVEMHHITVCNACGHTMTFQGEETDPPSSYNGEDNKISRPPGYDADAQARAEDALAANRQANGQQRSARGVQTRRVPLQHQTKPHAHIADLLLQVHKQHFG